MAVPKCVRVVEDYLSPGEAGRRLGTSSTWVTRLARDGRLDGVPTSLGWLIEPKSVEREAKRRSARQRRKVAATA